MQTFITVSLTLLRLAKYSLLLQLEDDYLIKIKTVLFKSSTVFILCIYFVYLFPSILHTNFYISHYLCVVYWDHIYNFHFITPP